MYYGRIKYGIYRGCLIKKTKYKKLGTGMRIIGFTVIMPVIIVIIVAIIYK